MSHDLLVLQEFRRIEVKGFDASLFQTTQVFYSSKDGTKIPMFIVHRKVCSLTEYGTYTLEMFEG